jgi:acyl carrier protein
MVIKKIIITSALVITGSTYANSTLVKEIQNNKHNTVAVNVQNKIKKLSKIDIRQIVYKTISEMLGQKINSLNDKMSFTNDLGADSLDFVELIMEFENKFKISIPDSVAEKLKTVGQTIDTIYILAN